MRPVFVIDVNKCVGCRACVAACIVEHGQLFVAAKPKNVGLPQTQRLRTWVSWVEREEGNNVSRMFISHLCYHCDIAYCVEACPTGASFKTREGIVLVDKDKCIACRYCMIACPYGMRYVPPVATFKEVKEKPVVKDALEGTKYGGVMFQPPVPNKWATRAERVVDKCTYCYHRYKGDGNIWTPACVEVCPTGSRLFGDLDDPNDPVAELARRGVAKPAEPSKGTGGRTLYVGL